MAKESLTKTQAKKKLQELIPTYGEVKINYDKYKKEEGTLNKEIKSVISQAKLTNDDIKVDGWKVDYSTRESVSWDEDAVLAFMHAHEKEFTDCIKTKEYVDLDVLEDLMYKNKIPKKLQTGIKKFMETKIVEVLKIKKG